MIDKRKPWETKVFYGACGAAVLIMLQAMGIVLPYETLYGLVFAWSGYSVADRLRKK